MAGFLARLRSALALRLASELTVLRALRSAETGLAENDPLNARDQFHYQARWSQRDIGLDDERLRRYLSPDGVLSAAFQVLEAVLGLRVRMVEGAPGGGDRYWVRDTASGELLPRFYADLYARPGKTATHQSRVISVGTEGLPRPCFRDVRLLVHGLVMHRAAARARHRALVAVPSDFVEAPSELVGCWVYEPEVLRLISLDPERAERPRSGGLERRLVAARGIVARPFWSGQLGYAFADLDIPTFGPKVDSDAILRTTLETVLGYRGKRSGIAGRVRRFLGRDPDERASLASVAFGTRGLGRGGAWLLDSEDHLGQLLHLIEEYGPPLRDALHGCERERATDVENRRALRRGAPGSAKETRLLGGPVISRTVGDGERQQRRRAAELAGQMSPTFRQLGSDLIR